MSAPAVVSFEVKLDTVWQNQPMKYNYKKPLETVIIWKEEILKHG